MTNKNVEALLAAQIKISTYTGQKEKSEALRDDAHRQYKLGLWVLLFGLIIAVVLNATVGLIMVFLGGLTAVTQVLKRDKEGKIVSHYEDQLSVLAASIAQAGS